MKALSEQQFTKPIARSHNKSVELDGHRVPYFEGDPGEQMPAFILSQRLAAIVESSDDAIISKDLNGIIATWNRGAERIFGYTAEEVIGESITLLLPPERYNEEPEILHRIRNGQQIDHYETVRRRKDGTLVDISLTVSPVKDADGRVIGASKIARDITARKRAEAELRSAKDEFARLNEDLESRVRARTASLTEAISHLEEFSYTVSHDLRAPTRSMKCYAQIVLEDFGAKLDPEVKDYLERIRRGAERMDRLIQDVLTYSRLSRSDVAAHPVSLDSLVADIIQQYPEMQAPRAAITVRHPLLNVFAHEPSLVQAVSNLLINAVKFMPAGRVPEITVRSELHGPNIRLWIEDNGIGIKPEHQDRLFRIFERLSTNGHYEGTGIGLAIVRKAAEKMGGAAGVESDGLTGSRFWIELPAASN
jgi:PAS domain S-box-containing protein